MAEDKPEQPKQHAQAEVKIEKPAETTSRKEETTRKPPAKRTTKRKRAKTSASKGAKGKRNRVVRPFPASGFEESLEFAKQILEFGSGQPVRRLILFDHLKKAPDSGPSRMLIITAGKYGLIQGGYNAETLSLTPDGIRAANDELPARERAEARIKLAIDRTAVFKSLYDQYVGGKLPAKAALTDAAKQLGVAEDAANEAVDTFIVNLRFLNLLQTLSGAERIVPKDHVLEGLPSQLGLKDRTVTPGTADQSIQTPEPPQAGGVDFSKVCFYITPIGLPDSENRKHSDLLLNSIVEPALEPFGLQVIRADLIDKPGIIGKQIIDYIVNSKLVVVDLSFHNPNVFYELAIRHMMRKPIVQIIRKSDSIPFDINQVRTIIVDTTDLHTFVPKMETYKSEIANQARQALNDVDSADNPISLFYPALTVALV